MPRRNQRLGMVALVLANLMWAASYPATAVALHGVDPVIITLIRLGIGAVVMSPFLKLRSPYRWTARTMGLGFLMGILGFTMPVWLQTVGVGRSTPGIAAMSIALEPAFTVLVAAMVLRQRLLLMQWIGIAAAVIGSWAIAGFPRPGVAGYLVGDAILLVAILSWSIYNVLSQPLTAQVPAAASTAITLLAGFLTSLPLMMTTHKLVPHHLTSAILVALGFLAIGATVGAYLLWMLAVERLEVAHAAIYLYIQPIAGVLLSVVLTGTRITEPFIIGSLMILGALFLGQHHERLTQPTTLHSAND